MQDTPDLQLPAVVVRKKVAHGAKHVLSPVTTKSFTAESFIAEPQTTAEMATQSAPQAPIACCVPASSLLRPGERNASAASTRYPRRSCERRVIQTRALLLETAVVSPPKSQTSRMSVGKRRQREKR